MAKDLGIVGTVARFKPVHKGHAVMLETLCERSDYVYIGLGSSNRYNVRNPFTPQESAEMIDLVLKPKFSNYSFVEVPDLDNGPKWRELALGLFGKLDHFVTANDYVETLLKNDYSVIHPARLVPQDKWVYICATMVRDALAKGEPWEHMVPDPVTVYLKEKGLADRFVKEFGLATLATLAEKRGEFA
ncbi:MAG: hypothetical protein AABX70_08450 [Nanoarchaeota archaeon]